jgi:hypothetical protein
MRRLCPAILIAVLHGGAALAAPPEIKPTFDLRLRWEGLDTPARTAAADRSYDFTLGRFRLGLDAVWPHWTLRGMVQAAGALNIPENPAFAAGTNYLSANGGDTEPSQIGIAELSATYANGGFKAVLGRQPYVDGFEVQTGVAHLDAIKRRLLSDRLIGVFEWPNVGRRFDGASFGYGWGSSHLAGFALRPLHGAFDHEDAFEPIDDVTTFGLTLTGRHGGWIPGTEVRIFAIQYEDSRAVARRTAGGDLTLTTAGTSFLAGGAPGHVLVWVALQTGDWGTADQDAWAYVLNVGRSFAGARGKPMVHLGLEQSSGDAGPGGDHETFFNLLPTNHKYYGIMDYVDLPNLRDLYVESLWTVGERTRVRLAAHDFALSERTDAWYGGSGPFEEESFGYAARVPAGGLYPSKDLGREADVEVNVTLPQGFGLGVGGGYFWGGEAAEAFAPIESDGNWTYVELTWKR